jgi:quercetin dioxygenase-like cupin family protein
MQSARAVLKPVLKEGILPKQVWVVAVVCLALNSALAQDPLKVESKHYSLAFENESVQVVNVHYGPHEKSALHDHPGGVVIILTGGHLRFTDQNGVVREVFAKPGESRWFPPLKHRVENLGDTIVNSIYIGIKSRTTVADAKPETGQPAMDARTRKILTDYILASIKR